MVRAMLSLPPPAPAPTTSSTGRSGAQFCARTSLTPIDQWPDTDEDRLFLPSFVFPRDAALTRVLLPASRNVRMLRDDPGAGFDGYQCLEGSDLEEPEIDVDNQVQAVWYAILQNTPITYFNPPATYPPSSSWQRVRTPTETIDLQRGTCIDLALLFCACLEVLEIYIESSEA